MKSPETKVTSGGDVSTSVHLRQAESCVLPPAAILVRLRIVDHQNHAASQVNPPGMHEHGSEESQRITIGVGNEPSPGSHENYFVRTRIRF
jgi:hypothetical protein